MTYKWFALFAGLFIFFCFCSSPPKLHARSHHRDSYGGGFSTELPNSEEEVLQALDEVVNDGIIEGSVEYNKDKYIEKAAAATDSPLFTKWTEPGRVFYKVRYKVLSPTNFKETNDEGTLAVRYVVQGVNPAKTILRIDAVFAEDFRRVVHPSNGTVESSEYKDIQDHIDAIELAKKKDAESKAQREQEIARRALERKRQEQEEFSLAEAETSGTSLEKKVEGLRRQAERVVKSPGATLKSAPFQTATTLRSLEGGSEVVVLVITPYWLGVETTEGQHGWVNREQLEPLP